MQIVREELDAIGAHEMLMPVLNPAEIWQRSGRYEIDELFKLKDRKGADLVLALTHEEIVTTHVAQVVRSYRDLPLILYHFQIKGRDEPRPRAGVLRTREFIMKDSYTFDRDRGGPGRRLREAPRGLRQDLRPLRAGVVPGRVRRRRRWAASARTSTWRRARRARTTSRSRPGYAANVEVATAEPQPVELPEPLDAPEEVSTPGMTTVAQVCEAFGVPGRRADQGLSGDRRRRAQARARPRRPPRQRHQAHQRARRAVPAGAGGRVRGPDRPGGLHRPGRHRRADPARQGARAATATSPAPTRPTRTCAASSRGATSSSPRSTSAASSRATPSTGTRSGSSRRSRSATSSSSARATRSRSARPTSTRTASRS